MTVSWLYQYVLVVSYLTPASSQCIRCVYNTPCNFRPGPIVIEKCCNISQIPPNSLDIDYLVTRTNNSDERWRLDATAKWQAPTEDDGYTYSVNFRPEVTLEDLALSRKEVIEEVNICDGDIPTFSPCPSKRLFSTVVEEATANFTSLLFGFTYFLQIQVIFNGVESAGHTCYSYSFRGEVTGSLLAPDCLASTGDIEFCQNQLIPVATEPRNLEVEWTKESMSATVYVKWSKPLVVNGKIARYRTQARRLSTNATEGIVFRTSETGTEINVTFDHPGTKNGGFLIGYSYLIMVIPVVNLPEEYRSGERTYQGNIASTVINITAIDEPTTPEINTNVTERAFPSATPVGGQPEFVILLLSILAVLVVLVVIIVLIVLVYRRHRAPAVSDNDVTFQVHTSRHKVVREVLALPEFRDKEVYDTDSIELVGEPIGGGQYGKVYMGYLRLEKNTEKKTKVAVKTTKDGLHATMQEEFLDEIRLMMDIGEHPNIMPVIACKTIAAPYYLITEYMDYGSLKDYLQKCNEPENVKKDPNYMLTGLQKVNIAHQISIGMVYLSSTRYFHGDLAARNILINKNMEVKISDFGLSNDIYARGYVRLPPENKRPVKWYSPEANIHGRCSTEGDVWSYGVVLHEIYCFGRDPYQGMAPREVIVRVKAGYRLEQPEGCPNEVYDIMCQCWQYEPSHRPTFESIKISLEKILDSGIFEEEDEEDDK
ncbi:Tyrosine-protein kinase ABL2 [Holothuria leucospilota]|uniref:Tyrosine-protein kinase ABL2 n=1 Tax=Holothuria leucospilota TaxID=206669 RepID=A0A9Q0YL92_HOLLE|nr:Tyrosine-protein kinase ABL2 [Holothuria leucospilota]